MPGQESSVVLNIYSRIRICHVHGLLDDPKLNQDMSGREYRPIDISEELHRATDKISIIHEYEKNKGNYPIVHDMIETAQSIVFLGFGFHSLNLDRLDVKGHLHPGATVYGSTLGMTDSEVLFLVQSKIEGSFEHKTVLNLLRDRLEIFM